MNVKTVTLPLSPTDMVEFFKDKDQGYEIDVDASLEKMNERAMLLYLSNLGIKCAFTKVSGAMMYEYMLMKDFVEAPMLTAIHANILYFLKYGEIAYPGILENFDKEAMMDFIEDNQELVIEQAMFLDSFLLYAETRKEDSNLDLRQDKVDDNLHDEFGFSLLKLLSYEDFMIIWSAAIPPLEEQTYYSKYFDDYMFKGQNLFFYASKSPFFGMLRLLENEKVA